MDEKKTTVQFSRRDFLKLGASGVAAIVLARCAPAATPAPEAPPQAAATEPPMEPVTIDFLAWGDNADIPAWEKLSKDYMAAHSNVTVNVTTVADPNANYYPKLQTAIAGGTPPTVASFQGWEWQTYADKDLLAAVDDYIKRDNLTAPYPSDVKSITDSTKRKEKTYLIPLQVATMIMFYAKKHFDEAGISYPTDEWTFEEFLDIATKLTNVSGENKRWGLQANGSWFRDIGWIRGTGKQEFDSIIDPKKSMFSQPEIVEIIQRFASDVYYTDKIAPSPADLSGGANTIVTGNCAMKYEGPWWFPQMNSPKLREEGKQVEFDVVLMPKMADAERPHRGWAEGVVLLKTDKAEAGWGFASYMAGDEGNKVYSDITGRLPNNLGLLESFWLPKIQENFQVGNGKAFLEAFKRSEVDVVGGVPRSKMWGEVVKPVGYDPLTGGSAKAADVLPKVDEGIQKLLDEYWASV
jgi:multiple sugar transport system substrate-binding protein